MLDGVLLDQLRTFIAAVDEGSFSAAAVVHQYARPDRSSTVERSDTQASGFLQLLGSIR
jgi:hypothetical protein